MDHDRLRLVAATRPGYATYPTTAPGSPSWWRRPLSSLQTDPDGAASVPPPATTVPTPPLPSAGRPCRDECVLVVRQGVGVVCVHADHRHDDQAAATPSAVEQAPAPGPVTAVALAEHLTAAVATPRRRWWHRLASSRFRQTEG